MKEQNMKRFRNTPFLAFFLAIILLAVARPLYPQSVRWSEAKAESWYQQQPWLVGSNYIPSTAINQLEMWQEGTFDPDQIDKELGWAEKVGMNTMRVFLHDLLWQQDPEGFRKRLDSFLTIASKHHIRPVLVLFDSCWDPYPKLGPQHPPIPGVHNSGWVQSPGAAALADSRQYPRLEAYVQGVVKAFAKDDRVLAWDVWNEPSNTNGGAYGKVELKNKQSYVLALLPRVFEWVRAASPSQPLTSGVWEGDWSSLDKMDAISRVQIEHSDIVSFHNYSWPEDFEKSITRLEAYHRPLLCTEYMARGAGSTFDTILPIAKEHHVGAINWGLVAGKTQTYLPWDSWAKPYVLDQPTIWFHEVFHPDGKPYREREASLIHSLTERGATIF
jgi:Cellulase (glycosyl hydrolase family 5)